MAGLTGALIGAGVALWIYTSERGDRQREELVAALQGFVAVVDLLVAELRESAPPRQWLGSLSRRLDHALPELRWITRPLAEAIWRRPTDLIDRYYAAMNRLLAVGDQQALREVERVSELIGDWNSRGDRWEERWAELRIELKPAFGR